MAENKLYQQCRIEAFKQIELKYKKIEWVYQYDQVNQLAAELYAMKMADWIQPMESYKDFYSSNIDNKMWEKCNSLIYSDDLIIGTTQDLHDRFVKEGNETV